jgi:hypothetical protein
VLWSNVIGTEMSQDRIRYDKDTKNKYRYNSISYIRINIVIMQFHIISLSCNI